MGVQEVCAMSFRCEGCGGVGDRPNRVVTEERAIKDSDGLIRRHEIARETNLCGDCMGDLAIGAALSQLRDGVRRLYRVTPTIPAPRVRYRLFKGLGYCGCGRECYVGPRGQGARSEGESERECGACFARRTLGLETTPIGVRMEERAE